MTPACSQHQVRLHAGRRGKERKVDLAEVFRRYGEAYRLKYRLPTHYCRVMRAIEHCRTRHMGGHLHRCEACKKEIPVYNPCGNRHCPRCQNLAKARWLAKRKSELLPVGYFHYVFTLPHDLNPLVLCNRKILLTLLFASVHKALAVFGADPQWRLEGQVGFIAVLHTWSQTLWDHFHLHCIIPGGVLRKDGCWKTCSEKYLFRIDSIAKAFRNIYLEGLSQAYRQGKLSFPGQLASLGEPGKFAELINCLQTKGWICHAKRPFAGPKQVLDYLGRYTHRVAISNHRILSIEDDGHVQFSYKDRQDQNKTKTMSLTAQEFIRRFLLHVLPKRFMKIRYYGYLAHRHRRQNIQRIRDQIPDTDTRTQDKLNDTMEALAASARPRCPHCGSLELKRILRIPSYFDVYCVRRATTRAPPSHRAT